MSAALLQFVDLGYRYPGNALPTLEGLTFDLPAGQVTAILGPNGAGKSTLLRLVYGRYSPTRGQIVLAGKPLGSYSRQELGRQVALVPQREHSPFEYTLLEYVLLGRAPYLSPLQLPGREDCRIALEALALVGMEGQEQRSLHTLSGGEHQLTLIARALAQQPQLLLLDEPTAHLDLANKKRLVDCLKALTGQGVTVLMSSHEPDVVSAVAQQLVLVHRGRVLEAGPLETVWTAERLSAVYGLDLRVEQVDGRRMVVWE